MVKSDCCESFLSHISWRNVYVRIIKYHSENFLKELGVEDDYFTVDLKERKLVTDDDDAEENVTAAEGQIAADGINSSDDDHTLCEELEVSLSVEEKKKKQTTETSAKEDSAGIGHDEQRRRIMQQSSHTPFSNRSIIQQWVASVLFLCLVNAARGAPFPCGLGEKLDKTLRRCVTCDPGSYADKNQHWDTSCRPCDEPDDYTEIEKNCTPTSNTKLRCKPGYTQDLTQKFHGLMCNKCPEYPQPCNSMQTTEMPAEMMTNSSLAYTEGPTRKTSDKEPPDDSSSYECCTLKIIVIVLAVLVFLLFLFIVYILWGKDICKRRLYSHVRPTLII